MTAVATRELPVYNVDTEEKVLSISFDAAWGSANTEGILDILDRYDVKTTFFLVGFWAEKYPELVQELVARGHEIGNHSYSHVDFVGEQENIILQQMDKTDALIRDLTGTSPGLARVPSGSYDSRVIRLLRRQGYEVIQWDVDSVDWQKPPADEMTRKVVENVQNGSIVLFHSGADTTMEALPDVIAGLREKGYRFTTVGNLLLKGETVTDHTGRQIPAK